jgi:hypothetical protein
MNLIDPLVNPTWMIVPFLMLFFFGIYGAMHFLSMLYVKSHGSDGFIWGLAFAACSVSGLSLLFAFMIGITQLMRLASFGAPFGAPA